MDRTDYEIIDGRKIYGMMINVVKREKKELEEFKKEKLKRLIAKYGIEKMEKIKRKMKKYEGRVCMRY